MCRTKSVCLVARRRLTGDHQALTWLPRVALPLRALATHIVRHDAIRVSGRLIPSGKAADHAPGGVHAFLRENFPIAAPCQLLEFASYLPDPLIVGA